MQISLCFVTTLYVFRETFHGVQRQSKFQDGSSSKRELSSLYSRRRDKQCPVRQHRLEWSHRSTAEQTHEILTAENRSFSCHRRLGKLSTQEQDKESTRSQSTLKVGVADEAPALSLSTAPVENTRNRVHATKEIMRASSDRHGRLTGALAQHRRLFSSGMP